MAHPATLIVRTSAFFSPWDEHNFVTAALRTLASGETFKAADDAIVSPTYVPDLVNVSLDLLIDGEGGIWHLANSGTLTWAELARQATEMAGLDARLVKACPTHALEGASARRPLYSVLGSERGALLPPLDDSLIRYVNEYTASWKSDLQPAHAGNAQASTHWWKSERQTA